MLVEKSRPTKTERKSLMVEVAVSSDEIEIHGSSIRHSEVEKPAAPSGPAPDHDSLEYIR